MFIKTLLIKIDIFLAFILRKYLVEIKISNLVYYIIKLLKKN